MAFAFSLMAASGIAYCICCIAENKFRSLHYGQAYEVAYVVDAEDKTDQENKNFRYTY